MRNELIKINGVKEIDGMKFHDIEGGFGEGKKSILVKDIATIHGRELKSINRNINNNIKRFKNGIDILDLKVGYFKSLSLKLGYTNQSYANTKNIYLLSERGYSKLLKILEDDIAWEQYEKLVDGYFNMRKEIQAITNTVQNPELTNYVVQMGQFLATTGQTVASLMAQVGEVKELVKDSIQVKDSQIDKAMNLIGFRDVNTKKLSKYLKEKLTEYYGYTITASDEIYKKSKRNIFKEFNVIKWEDIPVLDVNKVFSYIDELEMIAA